MATGAQHILGYWESVRIDTADNVISKFFHNNPIPLEDIEIRWIQANKGDNSYLACALQNRTSVELLFDRINTGYIYTTPDVDTEETTTTAMEDLMFNLFQGNYYILVGTSLAYQELSQVFQLPGEPIKPQDWDVSWIHY